jgi:uncharacterized phage protein (TIGR02218 family)
MSKTIGNDLKDHFDANLTTLATCWRLTRPDGAEYFFTDHDVDLEVDGDTYEATSGMIPTALSQNRGLAVDNMEVVSFLESDKIVEADINAGEFDYAVVDIFIVNYEDLTMGKLWLAQGWTLGNVEIRDEAFQAEIRGKCQHLQQTLCELYTPECRAALGDARCGVDLADSGQTYWHAGAVTSITEDRRKFTDDTVPSYAEDPFRFGKLTWTEPGSGDSFTGSNAGYEMEIKSYDPVTNEFELFQPMPYEIEVGDEFTVTFGCDKSIDTCRDKFDNVVNFRGEPFVPGWDRVMDVAGPGM